MKMRCSKKEMQWRCNEDAMKIEDAMMRRCSKKKKKESRLDEEADKSFLPEGGNGMFAHCSIGLIAALVSLQHWSPCSIVLI